MWGLILKEYDPKGKDTLFVSVSALYTLEKIQYEFTSNYMGRARRLFSGLHGITFNTMANLFIIVNDDRSRSGAPSDRFRAGNPKVVNPAVSRIETLLEAI